MTELPPVVAQPDYAPPAERLLVLLKREGPKSLVELARGMGISKMGVHKHLVNMEGRGLVERFYERNGVGRPRLWFRLSQKSSLLFPKAYSEVSISALSFIERKLGRDAVEQVLRERQNDLYAKYSEKLDGKEGFDRVKELAKLRDEDGYMAEARRVGKNSVELLEHNCPILQIASKYQEACWTEQQLFNRLLGGKVSATHRAAVGDQVCRFMIQPRQGSLVRR